jgi:hypothetical protein
MEASAHNTSGSLATRRSALNGALVALKLTDSRSLTNSFAENILPLLLFPPLVAVAGKFIFAPMTGTALGPAIGASCASGPFALAYTSWPTLDNTVCGLVAFFHAAMEPESLPYTTILAFNLSVIPAFMFLESARSGRNTLLSSVIVTVISLVYQKFTAGYMLPLYWILFVITGHASHTGKIERTYASATLFAFLVGYLLPSAAMVYFQHPWSTALWQAFPIWMLLAQRLYLLVLPRSNKVPQSGGGLVRTLYTLSFIVSAATYLAGIWQTHGEPAALSDLLLPQIFGEGANLSVAVAAKVLLQWDGVFIFLEAMLASLWLGRNAWEVLGLLVWNVVIGALLGPGAALAAVYAWREGQLSQI